MKFCQSTSYGLVSYGYERHYDPSIFRPIFVPGGFSVVIVVVFVVVKLVGQSLRELLTK